MDTQLVDLIETDGKVFDDSAHVWSPATERAREIYEDAYFIDATTKMHNGCWYIATVGECRESIRKMNATKEMSNA